jgi:hypothetical protein
MEKEFIYLGFLVSKEGPKMDPEKVQAILNWPNSKNVFEVRRFHGLVRFYRKFIKNFSQICAPMVETIKESRKPFRWTEGEDTSFNMLKRNIIEKIVLDLPDFDKTFQVETHASGTTIGSILIQEKDQ